MATTEIEVGFNLANRPPGTRQEYLGALRSLRGTPWKKVRIGVLFAEVTGTESNWTAMSSAEGRGLKTHVVSSPDVARSKAIATMRAWVIRNIQDDASRAKTSSMQPGPAEQRALELMRNLPDSRLVRYRGGAWARPGLAVEGPGDLPLLGTGLNAGTGIAVLRKLVMKGLVKLDEQAGQAQLIV